MKELKLSRRKLLRGAFGGMNVAVGLPLLDCFLNSNGTALAAGGALPVNFISWFYGLGLSPGRWEPKRVGANYDLGPELKVLAPLQSKINVLTGMLPFLDSTPPVPHTTGVQAILTGNVGDFSYITLDQIIADHIGQSTRFRSLEVACHGSPESFSRRGASITNPSEVSPVAMYGRLFGSEFVDPNAADFKPDPHVLARKSVLSAIRDDRELLSRDLGAADKARMDQYFTSLRELEQRLELQLEKPAPLAACSVPEKVEQETVGPVLTQVNTNHELFAKLIALALACGQTRVVNVNYSNAFSSLRMPGDPTSYHVYTHEEAVDPVLGCQKNAARFIEASVNAMYTFISTLNDIREGDGTLLDRSLVFVSTDSSDAKVHSTTNIPMITAGGANGAFKTGLHINAQGSTVARVGLTLQQGFGVSVSEWGTKSNKTSRAITELLT